MHVRTYIGTEHVCVRTCMHTCKRPQMARSLGLHISEEAVAGPQTRIGFWREPPAEKILIRFERTVDALMRTLIELPFCCCKKAIFPLSTASSPTVSGRAMDGFLECRERCRDQIEKGFG